MRCCNSRLIVLMQLDRVNEFALLQPTITPLQTGLRRSSP